MFKFRDKEYELKLNLKRLKLIEQAADNKSAMAQLATDASGMMSISAMERFFAYGLKEVGSDSFVSVSAGTEICDAIIEEEGYVAVVKIIQEAVQRDCPFLFRVN